MQVSYKHSSALWQCNPYPTPKPDKSHCFSLSLLLHFPFLRIHDKNKRAQQSHKQNNLKTMTTPRFFLVDKLMIPNQTKILSLRKKKRKRKSPKNLMRICLGYNIKLKTSLNVHEPKLGTLALISAQEKIDRIGKQKKCKSRRRSTTTTLFLVIPNSAKVQRRTLQKPVFI